MFSLNGTLKKRGSVGRWETKKFIGMALDIFQINELTTMTSFFTDYITDKIEKE